MNNRIFQTPHSSVILIFISIAGKGNKKSLNDIPCTSKIQIKNFQLTNLFKNATKKSQINDFTLPLRRVLQQEE